MRYWTRIHSQQLARVIASFHASDFRPAHDFYPSCGGTRLRPWQFSRRKPRPLVQFIVPQSVEFNFVPTVLWRRTTHDKPRRNICPRKWFEPQRWNVQKLSNRQSVRTPQVKNFSSALRNALTPLYRRLRRGWVEFPYLNKRHYQRKLGTCERRESVGPTNHARRADKITRNVFLCGVTIRLSVSRQ